MIAGQLGKLFGVIRRRRHAPDRDLVGHRPARRREPATAPIGLSVVVVLFLGRAGGRGCPWPLIAVLGATLVTGVFGLEQFGVTVVGTVPQGLPALSIPTDVWRPSWTSSGRPPAIAVVAFTDNVLTARAFAEPGEEIDADAELRALGVANIGAGTDLGLPGLEQRLAHRPGHGLAGPDPRLRPGHRRRGASASCCSPVRCWRASRCPPSAGLVVFAAFKIVAVQRVPVAVELPAQRVLARHRRVRGRPHPRPARRRRVRDSAVGPGHAGAGRPAARGRARAGPRAGGHARHRRVPQRPPRSRACWCSATTPRCSSPMPRTSGSRVLERGRGRRGQRAAGCAACCSTARRSSMPTPPRSRPWRRWSASCSAAASRSPWRGCTSSSPSCSSAPGSWSSSARTTSTRPCRPPWPGSGEDESPEPRAP